MTLSPATPDSVPMPGVSRRHHSGMVSRERTRPARRRLAGMTLPEVLIAMTLGSIAMALAVSSFLLLGRSGTSAANYSMIATDSTRAIEVLAQDIRMASAVTWNSDTSITLLVENNYAGSGNKITYAYDSDSTSPTHQCFYSKLGDASAVATRDVLVRNVSAFQFSRFNRLGAVAANNGETRRIGVSMRMNNTGPTLAPTTGDAISANFYLRNQRTN